MKSLNRTKLTIPALLLFAACPEPGDPQCSMRQTSTDVRTPAGCAGMTQQEKGTATGAVVGGVVGNVLCGGIACTGAGAAVGGVIGHEVTKKK